jgi:hypothetical protein
VLKWDTDICITKERVMHKKGNDDFNTIPQKSSREEGLPLWRIRRYPLVQYKRYLVMRTALQQILIFTALGLQSKKRSQHMREQQKYSHTNSHTAQEKEAV